MKTYKYDPVCGKKMEENDVYVEVDKEVQGEKQRFLLCCPECHAKFEKDEARYIEQAKEMEEQGKRLKTILQE